MEEALQMPFTIRIFGALQNLSRIAGIVTGRTLLSITFLLLAIMPVTEHFWTFDKFLRGGSDLELGLLALVTLLCLIPVLSQNRKQHLATLLACWQFLSQLLQKDLLPGHRPSRAYISFSIKSPDASRPLFYTLPLQI